MLGGLTSYGSDSEGEEEPRQPTPPRAPTTGSSAFKEQNSKPSNGSTGLSSTLPLPKKRRDGPVRITVEAPKFDDEDEDAQRIQKKPRTAPSTGGGTKGAGSSSLFSALPAPKNTTPVIPEPKRVLGGGGGPALNFSSGAQKAASLDSQASEAEEPKSTSNGLFLPPSMAKGKGKAAPSGAVVPSTAAIDFFSLGPAPNPTLTSVSPLPASNVPQSASITLMSAPDVKDFEPPIPTLFDPYPGYYQLPSGEWAAHDPLFYKKVIAQLTSGVDPQAGTKTKSEVREFGGSSREDMATFDPTEELRKGQIAELEKRKAITTTPTGAPAVPRMKVQKATGLARTRHQLSTLLTEAYANREALEEKIAQGKRNRKEAGSKYGF